MLVEDRPPRTEDVGATDDLRALVAAAQGGDTRAFRELFLRYHHKVHRYAAVRLGDPEEARDVTQEVFLAAWRGLPAFRYEHEGSFPGWLIGIARNVVGTHRRARGRALPLATESLPQAGIEFESATVSGRMLHEELAKLPEAQREVLVLRFVVGLTGREAAHALEKSESAVTGLQVRALRRLRKRFEEGR